MATIHLHQPLDMTQITNYANVLQSNLSATSYNVLTRGDALESILSLQGESFTHSSGSLTGGIVLSVAIDGADQDLVPELVMTNLRFALDSEPNIGDLALIGRFFDVTKLLMAGNDTVMGSLGNDTILGFLGNDGLYGRAGNDRFEGGLGADRMDGGIGIDQAQYSYATGGVVADLLLPAANQGEARGDTYSSIENLRGSNHSDVLRGNNLANSLGGWNAGDDKLFGRGGNDTLNAGPDNDLLDGGLGRDVLTGDLGADRFDFNSSAESVIGANRDSIRDFRRGEGDLIDLSTIDADTGTSGNQRFVFIGPQSFSDYHRENPSVWGMVRLTSDGRVQGSLDRDLTAEFEITVSTGGVALNTSDFVL